MLRVVLTILLLLIAMPAWSQETDANNANGSEQNGQDEEVPTTPDAEGQKEYQDVEALKKLEASEIAPTKAISKDGWRPHLLAPQAGVLANLRQEYRLEKAKGPVGAAMLAEPSIRELFDKTVVLGLQEHKQPGVRAYLDFFDGRGKPILASWIRRMGKYEPLIRAKLREEGLPEDLIYVAMIESGFSPRATSPAAAVGVWQFIPTTGSEMGLTINPYVDERRDPIKATQAACDYLKFLYERFGSWPLALAAYNGGPGLVGKTIKRYNSNDYWFISRHGGMYDETRRYVPKVLAAGLVTKNANALGFSTDKVKPFEYEEVEVPASTGLTVFAKAAGTTVKELRELNPELLRAQTPPGSPYKLRIPKGSLEKFVKAYDDFKPGNHTTYVTKFGETLEDVAIRHQIPPRVLRVANGLKSKERVAYGTPLVIPEDKRGTWKRKKSSGKTSMVVPKALPSVEGKTRRFYHVEDGDSLAALARAVGIKPSDILMWNYLDGNAKLQRGMVLQLYVDSEGDNIELLPPDAVSVVVAGSAEHKKMLTKTKKKSRRYYHRVKSGESLWIIARKYRVTVEDLRRWNRAVRKKNMLQPGQKIVVYPGKGKRRKRRR